MNEVKWLILASSVAPSDTDWDWQRSISGTTQTPSVSRSGNVWSNLTKDPEIVFFLLTNLQAYTKGQKNSGMRVYKPELLTWRFPDQSKSIRSNQQSINAVPLTYLSRCYNPKQIKRTGTVALIYNIWCVLCGEKSIFPRLHNVSLTWPCSSVSMTWSWWSYKAKANISFLYELNLNVQLLWSQKSYKCHKKQKFYHRKCVSSHAFLCFCNTLQYGCIRVHLQKQCFFQ